MKMIAIPGKDYSIGQTTVTQEQWKKIMGTEPWKGRNYVQEGDDYPATYVSWEDAAAFCAKLSVKECKTYRLPTEAEWEYACLAGETTTYHFGDYATDLNEYAWFHQNAWCSNEKYAHRVAQKRPNQYDLYDMHGNVWEWCGGWYDESQKHRGLRGGAWVELSDACSAWFRLDLIPKFRSNYTGFRLASTISS